MSYTGKGHFDNGFKGGVHVLSDAGKVGEYAEKMLNHALITKQTDESGQMVKKVLVLESLDFNKEFYFAIVMDRTHLGPVVVTSKQGGMDIEEVAAKSPDAIMYEPVDIMKGIQPEQTKKLAKFLGFTGAESNKDASEQIKNLYDLFIGEDATQVEINPLVTATDGKVYCVDAKINFDDNAEYRHKEVFQQRDWSMEGRLHYVSSEVNATV
jgi:succinyl-CoA synthetase beta subunit